MYVFAFSIVQWFHIMNYTTYVKQNLVEPKFY